MQLLASFGGIFEMSSKCNQLPHPRSLPPPRHCQSPSPFATPPCQLTPLAPFGCAYSAADMHLRIRTARWLARHHRHPEIMGWCDAMIHLPAFIVAVACRAPSPLYYALRHGRVDPDECTQSQSMALATQDANMLWPGSPGPNDAMYGNFGSSSDPYFFPYFSAP